MRFANVDPYLLRSLQCRRSFLDCLQHFLRHFIPAMYCMAGGLSNSIVIVFSVRNHALPVVRVLIFRDLDFERALAFLGAGVAFALILLRPGFVGHASIACKHNLVYFFGSSTVTRPNPSFLACA